MTKYLRRCYDTLINKLAFEPPVPSYSEREDILWVYAKNGDKIAMRCVSDTGEPYSKPSSFDASKGLMVCCHGNADDIGSFDAYARTLAVQHARNVIWFDYPGYGQSTRTMTTEQNMSAALQAVLHYSVTVLGAPMHSIVLFGKSIGTVPAIRVAAQTNMRELLGVILVSPLASGVRAFVPAYMASADACSVLDSLFADNMRLITRIEVPILFVHGYNDELVDVVNTRLLQARVSRTSAFPPLLVAAGHNDIESKHPVMFKKTVSDFIIHCKRVFDIQADTLSDLESQESATATKVPPLIDI